MADQGETGTESRVVSFADREDEEERKLNARSRRQASRDIRDMRAAYAGQPILLPRYDDLSEVETRIKCCSTCLAVAVGLGLLIAALFAFVMVDVHIWLLLFWGAANFLGALLNVYLIQAEPGIVATAIVIVFIVDLFALAYWIFLVGFCLSGDREGCTASLIVREVPILLLVFTVVIVAGLLVSAVRKYRVLARNRARQNEIVQSQPEALNVLFSGSTRLDEDRLETLDPVERAVAAEDEERLMQETKLGRVST